MRLFAFVVLLGVPVLAAGQTTGVLDYETGEYKLYDVQRNGNSTQIIDYETGRVIGGQGDLLMDYETGDLYQIEAPDVEAVTNPDGSVTVFDYSTGEFKTYQVD